MVFSQVFVMAPIRSQDAELVFDVTQAKHSGGDATGGGGSSVGAPKRAGTCRVSLRELADQREHDLPLTVLKKASCPVSSVCWRRGSGQVASGFGEIRVISAGGEPRETSCEGRQSRLSVHPSRNLNVLRKDRGGLA